MSEPAVAAAAGTSKALVSGIAAAGLVVAASGGALIWHYTHSSHEAGAPQSQSAQQSSSGAQSAPAAQSAPEPTPTRTAPSLEELKNAALQMPEECAYPQLQGPDGLVALRDGKASHSTAADGASATLLDAQATTFNGEPVAVAAFECWNGGMHTDGAVAVYDADRALLGSYGAQRINEALIAYHFDTRVTQVSASPDRVRFTVPSIRLYGDGTVHADGSDSSANLTIDWDGSGFSLSNLSYTVPTGTVVAPDQDLAQRIYDAAAAGNDSFVAQYTTAEVLDEIQNGCTNNCETPEARERFNKRKWAFPPGGIVRRCAVIDALPTMDPQDGTGRLIGSVSGMPGLRAGDFACGLDSSHLPDAPHNQGATDPSSSPYMDFLVIRPTGDPADFTIIALGRNYS